MAYLGLYPISIVILVRADHYQFEVVVNKPVSSFSTRPIKMLLIRWGRITDSPLQEAVR